MTNDKCVQLFDAISPHIPRTIVECSWKYIGSDTIPQQTGRFSIPLETANIHDVIASLRVLYEIPPSVLPRISEFLGKTGNTGIGVDVRGNELTLKFYREDNDGMHGLSLNPDDVGSIGERHYLPINSSKGYTKTYRQGDTVHRLLKYPRKTKYGVIHWLSESPSGKTLYFRRDRWMLYDRLLSWWSIVWGLLSLRVLF